MQRFTLSMPRKKSKAALEGNGPVPQDTSGLSGGVTLEKLRRIMSEAKDKAFDAQSGLKPENPEKLIETRQRSVGLEQDGTATSHHGDRRNIRQEDSQAYRGRCSRSSDEWG